MNTGGAGGFVVPSLPSPARSTTSTTRPNAPGLPHPRGHALRAGSAKEGKVRSFYKDRMEQIDRQFLQKLADDGTGYKSMAEVCKSLDEVVNIVWLSGTPTLQIPFLLNIANEFNSLVKAFPPSPASTFALLRKLDHCFASLLQGQDLDTKETLPGFENGLRAGMSRTDMVRCKCTVLETREVIVKVMEGKPEEEEGEEAEAEVRQLPTDEETDSDWDGPADWDKPTAGKIKDDEDDNPIHMDVARVYEHTLVQLGETLFKEVSLTDFEMKTED
ncbi:hypothetical protein B0T18DRAFT_320271 [Schizothecium vesticola]|uniref:Meiotic recombination protein DMC1 n=1 Tax=Schizothecium vesticola TaxID=314040 RepID=A0AA40K9E5_9PEZI|nr:hypothetical protein B0T18DRAFT_320271 [Schizothecium vesticola]